MGEAASGVADGGEVAELLVEGDVFAGGTLDDAADDETEHFDLVGKAGVGEFGELLEFFVLKVGGIVAVL